MPKRHQTHPTALGIGEFMEGIAPLLSRLRQHENLASPFIAPYRVYKCGLSQNLLRKVRRLNLAQTWQSAY